jgi:hypothetical protein
VTRDEYVAYLKQHALVELDGKDDEFVRIRNAFSSVSVDMLHEPQFFPNATDTSILMTKMMLNGDITEAQCREFIEGLQ